MNLHGMSTDITFGICSVISVGRCVDTAVTLFVSGDYVVTLNISFDISSWYFLVNS